MYYFVSDIHLGQGSDTLQREKLFVSWLREIAKDAKAIFLLGDIFDFWFEYKKVVPKGFTRVLGALSELTDSGVEIHFFVGNHDQWMGDYLAKECGLILHFKGEIMQLNGKKLYLAHGHNEPCRKPMGVKIMNFVFRNRTFKRLFSFFVHPNCALAFGQWWSNSSRKSKELTHEFFGENEPLVAYARGFKDFDYIIFGHTHCAEDYPLSDSCSVIFLGEWINQRNFATLDESGDLKLNKL